MSATLLPGGIFLGADRMEDGHRKYRVRWKVKVSDPQNDGPKVVMDCPGLPAPGDQYSLGNDLDIWAFCFPTMKIVPQRSVPDAPCRYYWVEQEFGTKTPKRCQDSTIEDPLLEPAKLSGSFIQYTVESAIDKDGNAIKTSSHELVKGAQVEWDAARPTVKIEQNFGTLGLPTLAQAINTVNDDVLWGLSARTIKLAQISWERLVYGTCNYYYKRTLDFEVNYDTYDRLILDEGTKVLNGHWDSTGWVLDNIGGSPPDPNDPSHFIQFKDRRGENTTVILNGAGLPIDLTNTGTADDDIGVIVARRYSEYDFPSLSIPLSL